jgi:hypothetical protein
LNWITKKIPEKINSINTGLSVLIIFVLILKFQLLFKIKIGWDEFLYLSHVHMYLKGGLTNAFQSFHVHFFTWLPSVSKNEVSQVIAARICLFFLFTGTCVYIYLIGKQILNRAGALFSVLCYVSLSNIIFHGASFRADSICSFFFIFSLYHIIKKHRPAASFILSAAAMAFSLMISIKAQFHLLAIGGVFVCLLLLSDNKKQTAVQILCFAVSFVIILFLLYFYHLSSLAEQPATGASEYLSRAGSKVIMLNKLFPGLPFFFFSVYENLIIWITFLIGIIVICWNGIRHKKWRYHGTPVFLLFPFLIPLLTLLFYRNAYPYYYVFIMAPAIIFCGVIMHHIAEDYKAAKTASYLFIAGIFSIGIFSNFLFHYSKVSAEQLTAQKEIISTVHQIFPEPVPYLDGCSVISSFPKVGFFMSTWGMEIDAFNDIRRPPFSLQIHPADILADDPDADQLDAAQKKDDGDNGGIARKIDAEHQGFDNDETAVQKRQQRGETPRYSQMRNGALLKLVTPSMARFHSFQKLNRVFPAFLVSRTYPTVAVLNPTQAKMPFMNRWFSGS